MKSYKIGIFLTVVLALLALLAVFAPEDGIDIAGLNIRYPSLRSILVPDRDRTVDELLADSTATAELGTLPDTVAHYRHLVEGDSVQTRFWLPRPDYLDTFWAACERAQADGITLRVLHYGDSQIEMDHITSRLRSYMQRTFGGGGPGMMPFRSITPNPAIRQTTEGPVKHLASFGDGARVRGHYGVMMQSFRLDGHSTTTFKPVASRNASADSLVRRFSRARLLANTRGSLSATALNDKQPLATHQAATSGVGMMEWEVAPDAPAVSVKVSGSADLYCLLLDDGPGVAVDNIPLRGCSGQQFSQTDAGLLADAYSLLDVGLIIMQFGGNSVPYFRSQKAISNYCRSMGRQIDYVHAACPGARIVFVGPSDMSRKQNGHYGTYPLIPDLIDSLIATANSHNAAYWSIYHAMGGWGSMPQWTRQGLAGRDYIHFSQKGADLMGDCLATAFENSYRLYRAEQRLAKQMASLDDKTKAKLEKERSRKERKQKKEQQKQQKKEQPKEPQATPATEPPKAQQPDLKKEPPKAQQAGQKATPKKEQSKAQKATPKKSQKKTTKKTTKKTPAKGTKKESKKGGQR